MADTMSTARARYYEVNGFGADGGDSLEWVPLKVLGFTLKIPNTDGRRRAVRIHDLHHIVTGYQTDLRGEAEIGAWELASGCLRWPAATILNLFALAIGMLLAPVRMVRAWARGRQTRNLYSEDGVEHLLPREVDEVRASLGLAGTHPRVRVRDVLATLVVGVPMAAVMLALVAAPIVGIVALIAALT
jgi:hypothetical protein